ncbi:glycoside hydrolase family 104 protein [Acinetobacter sp. TY2]|uniref:glycoside hydrolase family 24 protein n=1 Tax=Acinetobacter sp. TY2 TaxID=3387403 RepID=UPI00391777F9
MNRQQLEQYSQNPNVQKMLNLIAATEGVKHGYNTLFGNQRINSLNAHPNMRKAFKQTDGETNYTTAAGRYQFINPTWIKLAQQYGFKDFSAKNQDLGAIALIAQRGALNDVANGNYKSAIGKLGKEWASLPTSTYAQGKRSWDFVNKQLGQNVGHQDAPQVFQPERVPNELLGQHQSFQPEAVPKEMLQQQTFQPEQVPQHLLGG